LVEAERMIALLAYGLVCALAGAAAVRVAWRPPRRRGQDRLCAEVAKMIARDDRLPHWIRNEREWRFDRADMDSNHIVVTVTTRP
jgi:hypothetical protein